MSSPHDPDAEFIERELGAQYQLVQRLGHGAMGVVYLARDRVLHRLVAIKTLRRDRFDSPEERERFRGEARLSVQLAHPGIVSVYTFGETPALLYIVMQYVGGGSLADRLARTGRATPDETRRLLLELADVLDYAHRQGVIHRDIKPENILLAGAEPAVRPLLADFGVAAQPYRDRGAGSAMPAAGTAHYMSPEQLWGEPDVDRRSDLYSLGVLGYRLLAGVPPYDGPSAEHVSARRATSAHVPLHDAAPHAPRALCDVIERCLHEEPERRWRNARELHAALLRCDARPPLAARLASRLLGGRRSTSPTPEATAMTPRSMYEPSGPARGLPFDGVVRDVRYALRALARTPAFVVVAVLCLALGIGANAAIFSVVNAVLLRPLPYAAPERLVRVYETFNDNPGSRGSVSVPNLVDWRERARSFEHLAAYEMGSANLQGSERPERLLASRVSPELFALLGVRPLLGRTFAAGEDVPGRERVAVIGESLWRRRFAADPAIVGRSVTLDGAAHTVVGVLPAAFRFPVSVANDVWTPFVPGEATRNARGSHFLSVIARLRAGVSVEEADAEMRAIAADLARQYPDEQAGRSTFLMPYREAVVGRVRPALLVLLGAVGLVLLIACANVANLLLARAATRRREVAIRLALGASRTRIVRQLLTESVLLGLAGAAAGALLAWVGLRALAPLVDGALPMAGGVRLDRTVFAYLLGAAVLSGIAFGLVPALQSTRGDVREDLTDGAKSSLGRSQQRFRGALVVSEIALSLVLLVGAGLLMRGFLTLRGVEPGFDPSGLLTLHLAVPADRFSTQEEAVAQFADPVRERLRRLPGVQGAGLTTLLPVQESGFNGNFEIAGRPRPATPAEEPFTELRMVSPGYFEAMRIPLKAGRALAESDGVGGARNILVNEALARKYFGGAAAVGQRIRRDDESSVWHTIVGVVGDVRQHGLSQEPSPEMYYSHRDSLGPARGEFVFVVRSAVPPATLLAGARAAVQEVAPDQPVFQALTMEEVIADSLADRRLNLWLLGVFAAVALVLSAAGLYGVISYLVAQRSREIGIRMALGAQTGDVTRLVMRQGAGLTALGVGVGVLGALALTRLLASMLYGVSTRDPLTFAGVAAVLATVALAATYVPARRAARVNPLRAIRAE